jgi:purine nucleosidase
MEAGRMGFPRLTDVEMVERLQPPAGKAAMVLDTDAYNEIDDQFALVYSLLSPASVEVEAVYAAPFHNVRSDGPGDGMEKSYQEILRVLEHVGRSPEGLAYRGSPCWLESVDEPVESEATSDLIRRGMAEREGPLYVLAIGAITDVASALLLEPLLVERVVVVWLGGQPHYWRSADEFNLSGNLLASQVLFDSGVPLVQMPTGHVTEQLRTTLGEMERHLKGRGALADYLLEMYREHVPDQCARSKVLWDIITVAYMVEPGWVPTELVHAPRLTDQTTWSADGTRHFMRMTVQVDRDAVFADMFRKVEAAG